MLLENSKCRLRSDSNETVNYEINKCRKLALKLYKSRYDWVVMIIHKDVCKRLKFCLQIRFSPKNETHKILMDFEMQTDYLFPS